MPSTTTTENHSITYPAEGAEGWYATWETLIQDITDNFDNIVNFRCAILKDTSGNELMAFTATGSAVNHLGLANAATGNAPKLAAAGGDTNIDLIFNGKGTGSVVAPMLVVGQLVNFGITYSSSVLSVSGAKAALSSTNPGFICMPSKGTPGLNVTIEVTADQGFIDDSGASEIIGNLFGATTGVAWGDDCPFYIYAVVHDDDNAIAFMCSRIPSRTTAPAVGEIGAPDDAVADEQYSFFSFDNIDETKYDGNPCICIGSFRMQMSSSDDWTVQALSADDGIGRFQQSTWFDLPQGQVGAKASSHIVSNAGTEPTWSTENYEYKIDMSGMCQVRAEWQNATAGVGTQDIVIVTPFAFVAALQNEVLGGVIGYEGSGQGNLNLHVGAESSLTQGFKIWDQFGVITPSANDRIENEDVDTNDDLIFTLNYRVRDA